MKHTERTKAFACIFVFSLLAFSSAASPAQGKEDAAVPSSQLSQTPVYLKDMGPQDPEAPLKIKKGVGLAFEKGDYAGISADLRYLLQHGFETSPDVHFYLALIQHKQLEAAAKQGDWAAVYDKGPQQKKEMNDHLLSAEKYMQEGSPLGLNIKFLKWKIADEEEDPSSASMFEGVIAAAKNMDGSEALLEMKAMADELSSMEDKAYSRRLYEVYAGKLKGSGVSGRELKGAAQDFLEQKNIYLAKSLFGSYLEQFKDDNALLAKELVLVADEFAHKGSQDAADPVYAEELYQKAFGLAGKDAFGADSQYRRAFNLERLKDHQAALREYEIVANNDPDESRRREAMFRSGVISFYGVKDLKKAKAFFEGIKNSPVKDTFSLSSFYQLGLLDQWENRPEEAQVSYKALLGSAEQQGVDVNREEICVLATRRLLEIGEKKPFEYGLRLFFEGTFSSAAQGLQVDMTGRPPKVCTGDNIVFETTTSSGNTGCMAPAFSYEWSGETGSIANIPNAAVFSTAYASVGIKVAHVAVTGNAGLEGAAFDMVLVAGDQRVQITEDRSQNTTPAIAENKETTAAGEKMTESILPETIENKQDQTLNPKH